MKKRAEEIEDQDQRVSGLFLDFVEALLKGEAHIEVESKPAGDADDTDKLAIRLRMG